MTVAEKVRLLEDTTVAWANAHEELLATLRLEKNRTALRSGPSDTVDRLFDVVDIAYARHQRMKQRLREINEQSSIT